MHDIDMLILEYGDDATPLLNEDLNNLNYTFRILKWIQRISGLAINNDETKVVKIGASSGRSMPWLGKCCFEWTNSFEILEILSL